MKYDWESAAETWAADSIPSPEPVFEVLGVAIVNPVTGEGCFVDMSEDHPETGSVLMADYFKDVKGDVDRLYNQSVNRMMKRTG